MKEDKNLSNQRSKKGSASFRSEASGFDCLEANPLTQKYDIAFLPPYSSKVVFT